MAAVVPGHGGATHRRSPLVPLGLDLVTFSLLASGFGLLYLPAYWELAHTVWATDEQGHGPIILALSFWLLFVKRQELAGVQAKPLPMLGWPLLVFALTLYALGRSQDIIMFAMGSQILLLTALILIFLGARALRLIWFPLFFLLFMVPLPEALVAAVTGPLKSAVSAVASNLLYHLGYPVGRAGVIITVGPYQLMVADACAGLNSMFTLEALGMLYMNIMKYTNPLRNIALAVLLIPISFFANIIRVMILVLVTAHFGDAAGQGFVHGFAGMVLFLVALAIMMVVDRGLGFILPGEKRSVA